MVNEKNKEWRKTAKQGSASYFLHDLHSAISGDLNNFLKFWACGKAKYKIGPWDPKEEKQFANLHYIKLLEIDFLLQKFKEIFPVLKEQQRALERQITVNEGETPYDMEPCSNEEAFLSDLGQLAEKYWPKKGKRAQEWKDQYRSVYRKCLKQPIAYVLMPAFIVLNTVCGPEYANLYAYLSRKKRMISQEEAECALSYLSAVIRLTVEHKVVVYRDKISIPNFEWSKVVSGFCKRTVNEENPEIQHEVITILEHSRGKNGRCVREYQKEKRNLYEETNALVKICSYNFYFSACYQGRILPRHKKTLSLLSQAKYLQQDKSYAPENLSEETIYEIYDTQLEGCEMIPFDSEFFEKMFLLAALRIPKERLKLLIGICLNDVYSDICRTIKSAINSVWREGEKDFKTLVIRKDNPFDKWILKCIGGRRKFTDNVNALKKARGFTEKLIEDFNQSIYDSFLNDPDNFVPENFHFYFENKYLQENIYSDATYYERLYIEIEAFSTIFELVYYRLVDDTSECIFRRWARIIDEISHKNINGSESKKCLLNN